MAKALDIPKGCKTRQVRFAGQEWLIVAVPWARKRVGDLRPQDLARIDSELSVIYFRKTGRDAAVISLLHEIIHHVFPSLKEHDVENRDCIMKDAIESFGVDLSPMLEGYE